MALEDSYNQLQRPNQDLKGRLNVHFQGEEGIDAGGLTREWYQLLSRVIFDKGAWLFNTVAKALFDGQLLDVYFTRSFYKHILGVKWKIWKANTEYTDIQQHLLLFSGFGRLLKVLARKTWQDFCNLCNRHIQGSLEGFPKHCRGFQPQRFQIHKAYGAPERLPSAHTCFNHNPDLDILPRNSFKNACFWLSTRAVKVLLLVETSFVMQLS
ncbi:E3 ubiquitin- protein ligase upl1 [Datura stramonium]|uniref:HECT-type E3 ubiquitin transferase n=1 Tax=Datura stramonium TaxID=4076 RepID=A0ABS8SB11_DATST|nr:E3 ubiquitin- protein ligase upl1 [Datura stramonium]